MYICLNTLSTLSTLSDVILINFDNHKNYM